MAQCITREFMNRLEIKKLLACLEMTYSNFNVEDEKRTFMVDTWLNFLGKYQYTDVSAALTEYIETSNSSFAPSVSQLIGIVKKHKDIPIKICLLGAAEAWGMVRKALQNSTYNCEEEFKKLPKLVQKAIGSANQLQVWAMDDEYNEGVTSSVFKKNYEQICQQELKFNELTDQQKTGVNTVRQQLLEGAELSEINLEVSNKAIETF